MSDLTNPASASVEAAEAYIAAILATLGDRDPWEVLPQTPDAVRELVAGLDRSALGRPEAPGKWSMAAVVQHLADTELVWGWRLRMIIAHERPAIGGYDQDLWADRLGYSEADPDAALEQLDVLRHGNLRLLLNVPASEREVRAGIHAERGEETLAHMVRLQAGHDLAHLRQLERIRGVVS